MVTNEQLYVVIGVPMLFNAALVGLVITYINAKIGGLESKFESRFDAVETRLDALEKRLEDLRDLWRAGLRGVEEVLDARLRHLEERG